MIIKTNGHKIKLIHNNLNRFWKPIGQYINLSEIKIDDEWYKCSLIFIKRDNKRIIQISHPMKVDEKTSIIKEFYVEGVYKEFELSNFKYNLIKILKNQHKFNSIEYNFRCQVFGRKKTIFVFLFTAIFSMSYYLINHFEQNRLMNYIAENNWIQTLIIFLTISSFINIFHPFTLRKEINHKNVEEISKETFEKTIEEKKQIERIRSQAKI